jgi:oxygen-dependent protoporphyrinogen oxidase
VRPTGSRYAVKRIAVVGAGIAGLTIAFRLRATHEVAVFEREAASGGKIRSQHVDGCVFDWGPNGFLSAAPELRELVGEAGLDAGLTEANPAAAKRSIYWRGALHELPAKPPRALTMSLLSAAGKARALGDLVVRRRAALEDESVAAFATRRFGREVAERIVAPALLGVSGGDAAATSVTALFPRLAAFEDEHGSVIRGMARAGRAAGRFTGFGVSGMQRLTDALAAQLAEPVRVGCAAERIEPRAGGWRVHLAGGVFDADAVVLATPAYSTAELVAGWDAQLAHELRRIPYAPMRVAGIVFRSGDIRAPLDGFGFLAARGQGVRILGALYTSTLFPQQAPAETAYLRVFLGGATDPGAVDLELAAAEAVVRADLAHVLGVRAEPIAYHERVWNRAIPQYVLGHRDVLRAIDARVARQPGLFLAGNAYRGLGVADTVRDAFAIARAVHAVP